MDELRGDAIAVGLVGIAGVMGLCAQLGASGHLSRRQIGAIADFMFASIERSQASPELQAQLHEAVSHHLSTLLAQLDQLGRFPPAPEA